MMCVILGDSIAAGVAVHMPECHSTAAVGISAASFVHSLPCRGGDALTVVSLGSNPGPADEEWMRAVRECQTGAVVWLLPPHLGRGTVTRLAAEFGDRTVDVRGVPRGADGIHPTPAGYEALARQVRGQ